MKLPEPVNRFPDFIRQVVTELKCVCPTMGKMRIAQMLARAGLRLSPSTVRRFLRQPMGSKPPSPDAARGDAERSGTTKSNTVASKPVRTVVAKYPDHVWHVDLTIVPTHFGFWVPWVPFSWLRCWPFAYWVAVVVDHCSRKAIASESFANCPTCQSISSWLDVVIHSIGQRPKYIISDQGSQFGEDYRDWCVARGITPRFGAVGQHGSITVVERFILSMKNECTRRILVPLQVGKFHEELWAYLRWYNEVRPHQSLSGRTPSEVYLGATSARGSPSYESRLKLRKAKRHRKRDRKVILASNLTLVVDYLEDRRHLPIVSLKRAA